jgi:hypothetical protein
VQLQLLDLMIPKECGAAPMDAATRADLIDLMARVLVAVFHGWSAFGGADHGWQDIGLERRAWTLADAISGAAGALRHRLNALAIITEKLIWESPPPTNLPK